ncbi:MAG: hypothetical protein IT170_07545 [Bryobacterales bacterium]|nr:hypothetical protein [Bryobacterales bacterium]
MFWQGNNTRRERVAVAMPSHGSREGRGERGFALLLVFAMAAIVAITLYMQLPRVAFEAQRDRETMLIERGKQYRRAIELYVRKNNRYPARLEDLEREQDMRFLRRRYKDPLTGKDEWRVIHINAAGQLEDSLIEKPKAGNPETASTTGDAAASDENVAENTALARQRPGDQAAANSQFPGSAGERAGNAPGTGQTGSTTVTDDGLVPILDASGNVVQRTKTEAEAQTQQAGLAGRGAGAGVNGGAVGSGPNGAEAAKTPAPIRLGPGGIPIIENPAAVVAGAGDPGGPASTARPGLPGIGGSGGAVAGGRTGAGAAGAQGSAQQILEGLLTQPRPGGLAGLQQQRGIQPAGAAGRGMGAGIAGVASKVEMKGILVYDEQESIHKWEFVYDAQKAAGKSATDPAQRGVRPNQPGSGMMPGGFSGPAANPNRPRGSSGSGGSGGQGSFSPGRGSGGRRNAGRP